MKEKNFIKNKKGLKLAAILHYPDKNKKYPAVVLLPGFTGYKEEKHIAILAKDLEKAGFVALRFDCSGFGESEGTPEDDYRMSNYLTDVESVYDFVRSLEFVDNKRIGIWGHSLGGMISIIFASKHLEIKAICAISVPNYISTALSIISIIEEWRHRGFHEKISSYDQKRIKIPYDFILDSQKYTVTDYISKLNQPLMIVVGDKDENVDPNDTLEIFKKAKEPKFLAEFSQIDHYYKKHPRLIAEVNKKVVGFFKKYL